MANEITISVSGSLNNTSGTGSTRLVRNFQPGQISVDQATKKRAGNAQALTQAWENIDQGDVTSGFVFLTNLDATYNVDYGASIGSGDATQVGSMSPGDPPALIHLPAGVTLMARASGGSSATATVDVEIWSR